MGILKKIFNPDILDILDIYYDKISIHKPIIARDFTYYLNTYHTFRTRYPYDEWFSKNLTAMVQENVITKFDKFMILQYLKHHK